MKPIDTAWLLRFLAELAFSVILAFLRKWYRLLSTPPLEEEQEADVETYTKREFAIELKQRISERQSPERIGDWAYEVFSDCLN